MNEWDRDNLDFFLSLSDKEFGELMDHFSADDFLYALRLIRIALSENTVERLEENDDVEDTTSAMQVLKKFTLKG